MKRSGLTVLLCAFIAVIILAGTASSAPKEKAPQDKLTFEGNLTLNVKFMSAKANPFPTVMYQIFDEECYITRSKRKKSS